MKKLLVVVSAALLAACGGHVKYAEETIKSDLRAPAYPLLTLHPHLSVWSAADRLTDKHPTFSGGKRLPFNGILRVDSALYLFMGDKDLPPQAIAPMALDGERWEAKITPLAPDEGWERPGFDDKYWNAREGGFGKLGEKGVKTQWLSPNLWIRREVKIDPYLLEHKRIYVRCSHKGAFRLYINGKLLMDSGNEGTAENVSVEVPEEILETMKGGAALMAAHCEKTEESALVDFGLFAEEPTMPEEALDPMSVRQAWTGRYTTEDPGEGWETEAFDDSAWAEGKGAFGTEERDGLRTLWDRKRLWVRRKVSFDPRVLERKMLYVEYSHNDGIELYINGKRLVKTGNKARDNVQTAIPDSILETMKDGKALLAARCVNWGGAAFADFGLYAKLKRAEQLWAEVQPTQTHYAFRCGEVELRLSFTDPRLPGDMETLARPVNYISYRAKSLDGKAHDVSIYFEVDPHRAFRAGQSTELIERDGLTLMRTGRERQELWVDKEKDAPAWGYFYLGTGEEVSCAQGDAAEMRRYFMECGDLKGMRRSDERRYTAFAQRLELDSERPQHLTAAFDGLYAMNYFGEDIRPYWNKDGETSIERLYREAESDYRKLMTKCFAFDRKLMDEATRAGGKEYAELCALAYRQTTSAFQLSESPEGNPLYFTTWVGPMDVYYSASPLFLYTCPELLKAMLNPFFEYSESGKWKKPFPPRKLEGYPFVNGSNRGGDWPIEEAGNALIMVAAIAQAEGEATYAERHWETLTKWAAYLRENGVDTGTQSDADAFVRKTSPRHANLSAKLVVAVAAYARLAETLGKKEIAEEYRRSAEAMAKEWMEKADAGDHYKLAFGLPDESWGLKYNLVWDGLLDLNLFPEEALRKELAFYAGKVADYGFPLESGTHLARAEWMIWAASMTDDAETFASFVSPLYRYLNETPKRLPMPDTYDSGSAKWAKQSNRPVVGGCFIKLLKSKWQYK